MDSQLQLKEQVAATVRGAFAQIHLKYQLHQYLDQEALLTVTCTLVTSHLDYCNMIYMGISLKAIQKQLVIQNAVAYAVLCASWFCDGLPDASSDREEELAPGTLEGVVKECQKVAEGSEPGVERPDSVERSLKG